MNNDNENIISFFLIGLASGFLIGVLTMAITLSPHDLRYESKLPKTCQTTEKVIVTTPTPVEYYICESHWVRR